VGGKGRDKLQHCRATTLYCGAVRKVNS